MRLLGSVYDRILAFGIGLVVTSLGVEFLPSNVAGIGPYQATGILVGLLIILFSRVPLDSIRSKAIFFILSIIFALTIVEIWLLVSSSGTPNSFKDLSTIYVQHQYIIDDTVLSLRIMPDAPDHDSNGWRNPSVLEQADIVTIGDSQTWGVNAPQQLNWPSQLARSTNRVVYNISLGGYGPVQYEQLISEALELQPDLILVGFYFGNDLMEAYRIVESLEYYADRRMISIDESELMQVEDFVFEQVRDRIAQINRALPVDFELEWVGLGLFETLVLSEQFVEETQAGHWLLALAATLNDMTLGELRNLPAQRILAQEQPDLVGFYEDSHVVTVFTPGIRFIVENPEDPRVVEGWRLSRDSFTRIRQQIQIENGDLVVVLIPTKEYVYADVVDDESTMYRNLIAAEDHWHAEITEFLELAGIDYVDTVPCLRLGVNSGEMIYSASADGHPNPSGYARISECISEFLVESGYLLAP